MYTGYKQKKEKNTLKLKKQDCLQNLSTKERDILPKKELKKGGTSHPHRLNRALNMSNYIKQWEAIYYSKEKLNQESSKRQKIDESSHQAKEPRDKEPDELSQEELQQLIIIVLEEGMNIEALQTKYLIIVKLWSLVQERFNSTEPTEDKEIKIWVELKRLFKLDVDDEL
ncbi:hypothetical protein Tco_1468131 [Tanacetum coccineum]